MTARIDYDAVPEGTALPPLTVPVTRADLVRYAGASGDFNPLHFSDRSARQAGFPSAIAHGMLTMALAGRLVAEWSGDPAAVCDLAVRFARPVPVPDDGVGARLDIRGTVTAKLADRRVRVALDVLCDGVKVLGSAQAVVQLN
ncbi:MaoC/PaaZ C-terminal domain-containing protein [Streptomyces sp. NPDC048506]|uniref:MaoC/PaaZ C-terminal domain-containing protein n=1 Tax=Streptomyces sp. NPDC048506 TaxID=3155028 RepID=UPI00341E2B7D